MKKGCSAFPTLSTCPGSSSGRRCTAHGTGARISEERPQPPEAWGTVGRRGTGSQSKLQKVVAPTLLMVSRTDAFCVLFLHSPPMVESGGNPKLIFLKLIICCGRPPAFGLVVRGVCVERYESWQGAVAEVVGEDPRRRSRSPCRQRSRSPGRRRDDGGGDHAPRKRRRGTDPEEDRRRPSPTCHQPAGTIGTRLGWETNLRRVGARTFPGVSRQMQRLSSGTTDATERSTPRKVPDAPGLTPRAEDVPGYLSLTPAEKVRCILGARDKSSHQ